jgi:lyso-ornithine lipid O-acyltransferase
MGSPVLGALRLAAYVLWTVMMIPIQWGLIKLGSPACRRLPRFYHAVCARLLGFRLDVSGSISIDHPTLFVSNHSSYLDITMLGALIEGSFIAKTEVGTWPFFGTLARLQRTVFVDRKPKNAAEHRDSIQGRLEQGDNLILFPEGTSSDGNRTLPFKSALFSVAAVRVPDSRGGQRALTVQPISIACTALDGVPLGRAFRPLYAWYGDMALLPHLWTVAGLGRLTVAVEFHPPVRADSFASRKALAQHCNDAISAGVAAMVSGRRRQPGRMAAEARGTEAADGEDTTLAA